MFRFTKKALFCEINNFIKCKSVQCNFECSLSAPLLNTTQLKCVSMNNKKYKARPETVNANASEPVFYPFSIKTSKCSDICNNINDPYAKMCVSDVVKDLNIKVVNIMPRTIEARHIKWH